MVEITFEGGEEFLRNQRNRLEPISFFLLLATLSARETWALLTQPTGQQGLKPVLYGLTREVNTFWACTTEVARCTSKCSVFGLPNMFIREMTKVDMIKDFLSPSVAL